MLYFAAQTSSILVIIQICLTPKLNHYLEMFHPVHGQLFKKKKKFKQFLETFLFGNMNFSFGKC